MMLNEYSDRGPHRFPPSIGSGPYVEEVVTQNFRNDAPFDEQSIQLQKQTAVVKKRAPVQKWTAEEDRILHNGIMEYLSKGLKPDYEEIAKSLGTRSVKQAKERWKNSLNPEIKKGEWSEAEIIQLLELIIERGQNWTHIQKVLNHRSMHCIKSKGRKLLGETVNKRLSKASKLKGVRKEWYPEEIDKLLELHKRFGSDLQSICYELKTGRPTAQADRKILSLCRCSKCNYRVAELKSLGSDFKLAWTQQKAREVKEKLIREGLPGGSSQQAKLKAQRKCEISAPLDLALDEHPHLAAAPKSIVREDELVIDSERNLPQMPFYKDILPESKMSPGNTMTGRAESMSPPVIAGPRPELCSYDSLLSPLGLDTGRHSYEDEDETERRGIKRGYAPEVYEEQPTREDALIKKSRGDELYALLDKALGDGDFDMDLLEPSINLDLTSFESITEGMNKQQQDSVMALITQTARRAQESKSKKLSQNIARFLTKYFSGNDLQTLSVHMRQQGIEFFNPSICFILDSITPNDSDPRYSKEYLAPEPSQVRFDRMRPLGTYVVNLASRLFIDVDRASTEIARGNMRGMHSWSFVPSRVEALLRIYFVMPKLFKTGEAWSHVRMLRCDGTEGVFLCHYKLINGGADAKIRFQDVSDRFQHVLELPPDLW